MATNESKILGVKNNKAKSRRQSRNRVKGYYEKQKLRTETNRARKRLKHQKKHPNDGVLFILFIVMSHVIELTVVTLIHFQCVRPFLVILPLVLPVPHLPLLLHG